MSTTYEGTNNGAEKFVNPDAKTIEAMRNNIGKNTTIGASTSDSSTEEKIDVFSIVPKESEKFRFGKDKPPYIVIEEFEHSELCNYLFTAFSEIFADIIGVNIVNGGSQFNGLVVQVKFRFIADQQFNDIDNGVVKRAIESKYKINPENVTSFAENVIGVNNNSIAGVNGINANNLVKLSKTAKSVFAKMIAIPVNEKKKKFMAEKNFFFRKIPCNGYGQVYHNIEGTVILDISDVLYTFCTSKEEREEKDYKFVISDMTMKTNAADIMYAVKRIDMAERKKRDRQYNIMHK
jgi:hypothetical protein